MKEIKVGRESLNDTKSRQRYWVKFKKETVTRSSPSFAIISLQIVYCPFVRREYFSNEFRVMPFMTTFWVIPFVIVDTNCFFILSNKTIYYKQFCPMNFSLSMNPIWIIFFRWSILRKQKCAMWKAEKGVIKPFDSSWRKKISLKKIFWISNFVAITKFIAFWRSYLFVFVHQIVLLTNFNVSDIFCIKL